MRMLFEGAAQTAGDSLLSAYSAASPLILLTDFPPSAGGGGAVILRSMLSGCDGRRLCWITLSPLNASGDKTDCPLPTGLRIVSLAGSARRSLLADMTVRSGSLAAALARRAAGLNASAVWVVLHGAGVQVAGRFMGLSRLPVHVTVHDDPAYAIARMSRRYALLTPWIERGFRDALRGARSVDVISDAMGDFYRHRHGVESVVVHRGLPGPIRPSPMYDDRSHELRIGVLGNTYGYDSLPILARALIEAARVTRQRPRLVLLGGGHGAKLRARFGREIEVTAPGHVAEPQGIAELSRCLLLYLNYPFASRARVLRTTSFPTKLSTYLLAARPLLIHAPARTSLSRLGEFGGYARFWTSREPADGAGVIASAWRDPACRGSADAHAEAVRRRFFDLDDHRRALSASLNALP